MPYGNASAVTGRARPDQGQAKGHWAAVLRQQRAMDLR
jgi:hypothetical protein